MSFPCLILHHDQTFLGVFGGERPIKSALIIFKRLEAACVVLSFTSRWQYRLKKILRGLTHRLYECGNISWSLYWLLDHTENKMNILKKKNTIIITKSPFVPKWMAASNKYAYTLKKIMMMISIQQFISGEWQGKTNLTLIIYYYQ